MPARLVPLSPGRRPVIPLQRPVLLVGRHPECDVRIDLPKVSRRHCCVALAYDRVVIRDLGSRNGVRVNGRVVEEAQLRPGDEVAIGPLLYRLEDPDAAAAPAPRAAKAAAPKPPPRRPPAEPPRPPRRRRHRRRPASRSTSEPAPAARPARVFRPGVCITDRLTIGRCRVVGGGHLGSRTVRRQPIGPDAPGLRPLQPTEVADASGYATGSGGGGRARGRGRGPGAVRLRILSRRLRRLRLGRLGRQRPPRGASPAASAITPRALGNLERGERRRQRRSTPTP